MLKLQYFGHVTQTANLLEKTLMQERLKGKEKGAAGDKVVRLHH